MRRLRQVDFLLLLLATIVGCAAVNMGTAWRYRNTGIEDIDPATARSAIAFPAGLTVTFSTDLTVVVGDVAEEFQLEERPVGVGSSLPSEAAEANAVVYGLPPVDVARAQRLQNLVRRDPDLPGSISARFAFEADTTSDLCAAIDQPLRIWTRRKADEPFRRLTSRRTIRTLIGADEAKKLCDGRGPATFGASSSR